MVNWFNKQKHVNTFSPKNWTHIFTGGDVLNTSEKTNKAQKKMAECTFLDI